MMFQQEGQRDRSDDTEYWECNGSTGSGVNRCVFLLLVCTYCVYCPTVG